jgi:hypothetical protein
MSTAVVSTSAALGRPFVFDDVSDSNVGTAALGCPVEQGSTVRREHLLLSEHVLSTITNHKIPPSSITPASQLEIRPAPEMVSSGVPAIDALTGGLPRGCLTEICGPASSGRTTLLLAALAAATRRGEFCVVVDASDALDPQSAAAAGVELERLLWVRCGEDSPQDHRNLKRNKVELNSKNRIPSRNTDPSERRLEQVLRATDLLLESGGFGLIVLDLGDLPPQAARRVPLTTWFRFRRAVEHKPTILLAIEQQAIAGSCSSLQLQLRSPVDASEISGAQDNHLFNDTSAAERRKNAAHGASRGLDEGDDKASEGRKKIRMPEPHTPEFSCLSHAQLLTGLNINVEIHSRLERKPACSVRFATKTAWAG